MENSIQKEPDSFWRKFVLIFVFFTITPLALLASVVSLVAVVRSNPVVISSSQKFVESPQAGVQVFASLPSSTPSVLGEVVKDDARADILRGYLEQNNSLLKPFAQYIVKTADKYSLDFRLITAIAQKESGLCRVIPEGSFNCWGWGIHSEGTLGFDSFEEGIETVSKGLRENYIEKGYITVEEIMKKYAHPSSTTWAEGVTYYMDQMQ